MKTVIMAGGKGTRISSIAKDIPKPMLPIDGKPVLEHEIESLREQGFCDIIITVSHLGNVIMDYFGDGKKFGVHIDYFVEKVPLGNAGALFALKEQLEGDFLLLNADAIFDIDFKRFVQYHKEHHGLATLFTHPNSHPYDSGLIVTGSNGTVEQWMTKEESRPLYYKNRVNAGLHVISSELLELMEPVVSLSDKVDLDRQLLKPLAGTGRMYAYDSPEYVKDMGTPERYRAVTDDFLSGRVKAKNLLNKQKAVFLDRDGTINEYRGFITSPEQLELMDGAAEAIRAINNSGYLAIVVSNQPVVARGDCTFEELEQIHNKLETELGRAGAYLDAIYFCPHHPDKGFPGEIAELKIDCACRKPKPGMLLQAAKDFNIDLSQSYMVGDSMRDMEAGKAAGCKTVYVGTNPEQLGAETKCYDSLVEFVNLSDKEAD